MLFLVVIILAALLVFFGLFDWKLFFKLFGLGVLVSVCLYVLCVFVLLLLAFGFIWLGNTLFGLAPIYSVVLVG